MKLGPFVIIEWIVFTIFIFIDVMICRHICRYQIVWRYFIIDFFQCSAINYACISP